MNSNIHANVRTSFIAEVAEPVIDATAFVHPLAAVIGQVTVGSGVFVGPFASLRGDEGAPIHIGDRSNVQDGVVVHGLETFEDGREIAENSVTVDGKRYSVYIGRGVSLAHQSQIHGPALVSDDTFVGMQALVFKSTVGRGCVICPGAKLVGVSIAPGRFVPAGAVITTQQQADALQEIEPTNPFFGLNEKVVHVNTQLAQAYSASNINRSRKTR